jgi:hypothetical protein
MKDTWFFWLVFFIVMTINKKGQIFLNGSSKCQGLRQIGHTKWPCLVKLAVLI